MKFPSENALNRFLNELFNTNCDTDLTVYELSQALTSLGIKTNQSTFCYTLNELVKREIDFLSAIDFSVIPPVLGHPGSSDYVCNDSYSAPHDGVVRVKPFHRLLLRAEVTVMEIDEYEFDHLVMLKYSKDPRSVIRRSFSRPVEFALTAVKYSKSYVHSSTNELIVSKHDIQWNAYHHFYITKDNRKHRLTSIPGFPHGSNWVDIDNDKKPGEAQEERKSTTKTDNSSIYGEEKSTRHTCILYAPYLLSPGFYTPRYCLDAYAAKHLVNPRELAKSPKSYYRGGIFRTNTAAPLAFPPPLPGKKRFSVKRSSVRENAAPPIPQPFTIKKENVGLVVECLDELEMVWAEDETFDDETDDEDDGQNNKKKPFFQPLFLPEYPYLPDREVIMSGPADKVGLYINIPKGKDGPHSEVSKFGLFFDRTFELVSSSATFSINEHEPLHKIDL